MASRSADTRTKLQRLLDLANHSSTPPAEAKVARTMAEAEAARQGPEQPRTRKPAGETWTVFYPGDWHAARPGERPCGPGQWRELDRSVVIEISDMSRDHLRMATHWAMSVPQHASKLDSLMAEGMSRMFDELMTYNRNVTQ